MGEEIPIFPLSGVVLFPRLRCPLHLFEPRYRQMTAHALEGEKRIGMVTVHPEHVSEMAGNPPVFAVGCEGLITENQKLPDGRYNIVLLGTQRFRIRCEAPPSGERLFRLAEVERLEDRYAESDATSVARLRKRILELAAALMKRLAPGRSLDESVFEGVDDVVFVNALCNAFPFPPAEKQGLLESDSILDRFEKLEGVLAFHLAGSGSGTPGDPERLH